MTTFRWSWPEAQRRPRREAFVEADGLGRGLCRTKRAARSGGRATGATRLAAAALVGRLGDVPSAWSDAPHRRRLGAAGRVGRHNAVTLSGGVLWVASRNAFRAGALAGAFAALDRVADRGRGRSHDDTE